MGLNIIFNDIPLILVSIEACTINHCQRYITLYYVIREEKFLFGASGVNKNVDTNAA